MTSDPGHYYDGRGSRQCEVLITFDGTKLHVAGEDIDLSFPLSEVRLSPPLGTIRRSLYLPNGGKCEVEDGALTSALAHTGRSAFYRTLHRWEKSLKMAVIALGIAILILWGFMRYGIPILAREAAYAIPPQTERVLGRESLEVLDRLILEPTKLPEERRLELQMLFDGVISDFTAEDYRLELRSAPGLAPNAFALPSGIVVLTDELVALTQNKEELAAVIAHEAGHINYRHALRQTLQKSATGLIIASLTGDILSSTSLAAALPTVLAEARFSRDLEREADDVAIGYLKRHDISVYRFADILIRLEKNHTSKEPSPPSLWERLFSTHPTTTDRLRRLKG